ncbi:hypothetical protein HW090_02475 [Pseudomonas sp. ABC1]|uniref:hypothetical protein n=1 Tax=Pseudomonas sp. ABC1 TaxID=2748080 RepID=UPI0015C314A2|nr:hypothetical protein [Pseudomonas sp. ABC1]QLF92130.1 hypothetical protein HW090_02475 [Pseudomonas sp. ABC1]
MSDMREARWLLQEAKLKSSLARLKILAAMLRLAAPGAWVQHAALHAELVRSGSPMPRFSMYQTLRRMALRDVLVKGAPGHYGLARKLATGLLEVRAQTDLHDLLARTDKPEIETRPVLRTRARRIGPYTGGPRLLRSFWLTSRLQAGGEH